MALPSFSGFASSSSFGSPFTGNATTCATSYLQSVNSMNPSSQSFYSDAAVPFFSSSISSSSNNPFAIFSQSFPASSVPSTASSAMDDDSGSSISSPSSSTAATLPSFQSLSAALPAISAALSSNNPFASSSATPSSASSSSSLYSIHIPSEVLQRRPKLAQLLASGSGNGKKRTIESIVSESMNESMTRSVKSRLIHSNTDEENKTPSPSSPTATSPPLSPIMKTEEPQNTGMSVERSNSSSSSSSSASLLPSERRRLFSCRDPPSSSVNKRVKGVNGGIIGEDDDKPEKEANPFPSHDYPSSTVNELIDWPKAKKSKDHSSTPVFTADQVAKIVAAALKKQEEGIRSEYNEVLNEMLREQWEQFSTFNQAYVSRHLSKSEFTYLS